MAHNHGLNAAVWLTAALMVVELVGGLVSGSLALLADAAHMASDVVALGLALLAQRVAARAAHVGMSYGYGRAKVLAAQLNGFTLCLLALWIVWEAVGRLQQPPSVQGGMVVVIASVGLMVNLIVMRWLHGGHDMNTRAAYWHVVGDALGSVAALVSGVVIMMTGWMLVDPILSFLVAMILAWGGWRLLKETTTELMEGLPDGVDSHAIQLEMQALSGVVEVHHIHVWRMPNAHLAISAHVQIDSMAAWPMLLAGLQEMLLQWDIEHSTLQAELHDCAQRVCFQPVSAGKQHQHCSEKENKP